MSSVVSKADIVRGLRALGLREGDVVLVHSSLRSFGYVEDGANAVIHALLETVGEDGTVMVPTLTWSTVNAEQPVFDVQRTPSVVGWVTEVFRHRPEAIRSLHPTHSVAAIGAKVRYMTEGHERDATPCSRTSPYGKLVQEGGYILFLGMGLECNTTFHAMEEWSNVPGRFAKEMEDLHVIDYEGNDLLVPSRRHRAKPNDFPKIEPELLQRGILRIGRIGDAEIRLVAAKPMAELALQFLKEDPCYFWRMERNE